MTNLRSRALCRKIFRGFHEGARPASPAAQAESSPSLGPGSEYVATHPEELQPAPGTTGVQYQGRYYLPARTIDETQQKSYDIYENRCLVGFLKTVLAAATDFVRDLGAAGAEAFPKAKGIVSQLQVQIALSHPITEVTGFLSEAGSPSR